MKEQGKDRLCSITILWNFSIISVRGVPGPGSGMRKCPIVAVSSLALPLPYPAFVLWSQASTITDLISAYCPKSLISDHGKLFHLFTDALLPLLCLQPPLSQELLGLHNLGALSCLELDPSISSIVTTGLRTSQVWSCPALWGWEEVDKS